ncbi:MAG: formate dehydrogenase accessory sulfurtransferase FdhD [Mycobacterium leprae]
MGQVTARRRVLRLDATTRRGVQRPDTLAVEQPLEIQVGGSPVTITMRTPGADLDLVPGWLVAEGVVTGPHDIVSMTTCAESTVDITLAPGVAPPPPRAFATTSACGVCGAQSLAEVRAHHRWDVGGDETSVSAEVLATLPGTLREAQRAFDATGGLHAAGLFTSTGDLLLLREDVGRHNALDKVVGAALRDGRLPLRGHVLLVSGRASFELTAKALAAGAPLLAAVSAPSTLAVDLAQEAGLTLVGFLRGPSMNVYAGAHRVVLGARD